MELKYVYIGNIHYRFTNNVVYSVWKFSESSWRVRDDENNLVDISYSDFSNYFISLQDYRNNKLEMIGI